jgi:serine/threonine protein phosphatase PrpC
VSEVTSAWSASAPGSTPGPTISLSFNLGRIPDQGEDSDPILRDGPDLGLVAVFDGMGGAGGTVYETPEGRRTGAYLASRLARDVVERRMLELLEPDWNLNGRAAASDLHRSVQQALRERLEELHAPPSGLRSRLLRALPTTMALVALQRTQPGGPVWGCHVLWAGDSRAYVFEPAGARQLTTDDLRDPGDALANLRRDSVVSNAISADTDFHVNYRKVELRAPFFVVCATDGCFGYVRTPMHFEHMVLSQLENARSTEAWSSSLQAEIAAVTGDDAAMSVLGVGAGFKEFQKLFAPRATELGRDFIGPLDELSIAITRAEQELEALRSRQLAETAESWSRYKPEYERYLRPQPLTDEDEFVVDDDSEESESPSSGGDQADLESESASGPASDQRPAEANEPVVPESSEVSGESELEGSEEGSS